MNAFPIFACFLLVIIASARCEVESGADALYGDAAGLRRFKRNADCDCNHHRGGCTISKAAPDGWKCVCTYKGFWTCSGWAQKCVDNEHCPGGDFTYCGCKRGGGDCGGYKGNRNC